MKKYIFTITTSLLCLFIGIILGYSLINNKLNKSNNINITNKVNIDNRFINTNDKYEISNCLLYRVYYDKYTKIVYLIDTAPTKSGITPLYNSKGQPMTYNEYLNEKK